MLAMHATDAANLNAYTRGAAITPEFEADYHKWLQALHRFSPGGGPLGNLMIALCDKHGLLADLSPAANKQIDFPKLNKGRRVFVTYEGPDGRDVTEGAEFRGLAPLNMIEVLLDSKRESKWVSEFRPHQISLVDPKAVAPPELPPVNEALKTQPGTRPELPKHDPQDEPTVQGPSGFMYRNQAFQDLAAGTSIKVLRNGVAHPATLVSHGPGDFQVTVRVGEETDLDLFDEQDVILPQPPKAPKKVKKANKPVAKKVAEPATA